MKYSGVISLHIIQLVNFWKCIKITNISYVITDKISIIKEISQMLEMNLEFHQKHILSLTSVVQKLNQWSKKYNKCELNFDDMQKLTLIFCKDTKKEAIKLIGNYIYNNDLLNSDLYRRMKILMKEFSPIYHYPLEIRSIIGTTNINYLISEIIRQITYGKPFVNEEEAYWFITKLARKILKYGKELIPNWDIMNKSIHAR